MKMINQVWSKDMTPPVLVDVSQKPKKAGNISFKILPGVLQRQL